MRRRRSQWSTATAKTNSGLITYDPTHEGIKSRARSIGSSAKESRNKCGQWCKFHNVAVLSSALHARHQEGPRDYEARGMRLTYFIAIMNTTPTADKPTRAAP